MKLGIIGYFTNPEYQLEIGAKVKKKIMESIENQLLIPFPLPKVKSEILEILLDTDGTSTERKVEKLSKTNRGKYLSFRVILPYTQIVRVEGIDLQAFIEEFFGAMQEILMPYGIGLECIEKCKNTVLEEIVGKKEYIFTPNETQKNWRESAKNLRLQRKSKVVNL